MKLQTGRPATARADTPPPLPTVEPATTGETLGGHVAAMTTNIVEAVTTDASVLAAVSAFAELEQRNSHVIELLAGRIGIGTTALRALVFLARSPQVMPKQLAEHLQLSTGATTNLVDRMEAARLLTRTPNPNDRRSCLLENTEEGMRGAREVADFYHDAFRTAVAPRDLPTVADALHAISDRIAISIEIPTDPR